MALVVQDGTGKSDADSYVSVADFKTYCLNRGLSIAGSSDDILEQKLRLATDYIDSKWRYSGERLEDDQSTEFPRSSLVDWSNKTITGVPKRVKDACCDMAHAAIADANLFQTLDRGGRIKSESVGPISVTYADDAPAGKVYEAAMAKLSPYIRDSDRAGDPYFGTVDASASDAIFEIGAMDNPGATADELES